MALLFPEQTVKCFTDEQLARGLQAVLDRGHRCVICREVHDDAHDAQAHGFHPPNVLDLFLEAARDPDASDDGDAA
jgi:hypothetical protein